MSASLKALLSDAIDYAGMFPPANLSMGAAAANYARYKLSADSWMLARFVCPAQRLVELDLSGDFRWRIAAVGRRAKSTEQFLSQLREDLQAVAALRAACGERLRIELFEAPLPEQLAESGGDAELRSFAAAVADQLGGKRLGISAALFEPALTDSWQQRIPAIVAALAAANQRVANETWAPRLGLKLRMGGATASSCPTSEQVALVIASCRDEQISRKATAGLHQPLRHNDLMTGAAAHGFVNLIAATVIASVHGLTQAQIEHIVDDQAAANFVFRDEALTWRDWRATTQQIRQVRGQSFLSFGSCSFDEPREGLHTLGWL